MWAEKNRESWNAFADSYSKYSHTDKVLSRIAGDPWTAFHPTVRELLRTEAPELTGRRICVPSSGDNHAVFAFALLGAKVTSCDIAENQLENASRAAEKLGIAGSVDFFRADTMTLEGVEDGTYDLVYTSNGVHVWIDDLNGMYRNIRRVLKPGGLSMLYEIHPFQRSFDDELRVKKPYDRTEPFERGGEVTFAWRVQDLLNAMLDAGLRLRHIEEPYAEKDYDWPFWVSCEDIVKGVTLPREEVDRMHDWRCNPAAALPNWLVVSAVNGESGR